MMKITVLSMVMAAALVACGGRAASKSGKAESVAPVMYGYRIVNSYPHDTEAYTQGLFWHEGVLWESTGEYGHSTMRRVELATGRVMEQTALPRYYFGEGAALVGGKIFQLTWLEERALVYDAETLERVDEFAYKGEGWGLTSDGEKLYMSDGTANISVRDPANFEIERNIAVKFEGAAAGSGAGTSGGGALAGSALGVGALLINELEWIDGKIWANIYLTNRIIIIDPATGRVEGVVDFPGIASHLDVTMDTDVMNGIAHDPATKRVWVTGKRWNRVFEIETFKK